MQGFCPLKIKITQFPSGFGLNVFHGFFPGAISIGNMKKGVKFRESSVLNFILLFKKSELFKISTITGAS